MWRNVCVYGCASVLHRWLNVCVEKCESGRSCVCSRKKMQNTCVWGNVCVRYKVWVWVEVCGKLCVKEQVSVCVCVCVCVWRNPSVGIELRSNWCGILLKQQEESLGHIQQRQISRKMAIDAPYRVWVEEENIQKTSPQKQHWLCPLTLVTVARINFTALSLTSVTQRSFVCVCVWWNERIFTSL